MKPPIMKYDDQILFNFEVELFDESVLYNSPLAPATAIKFSDLISTVKYMAYEEERTRFSMELHDHFGQELNVLKGFVDLLGFEAIDIEQRSSILNEMHIVLQSLINETRTLAFNLSPSTFVESELIPLLVQLFKRINLGFPNLLQFELPKDLSFELNQVQKQFIYRIVQEFVSNSIKHSGSDVILIELSDCENELTIHLQDHGCGFNLKKQRTGSGVSNIYKRLELLQATYFWQSSKKHGTQLTFSINAK